MRNATKSVALILVVGLFLSFSQSFSKSQADSPFFHPKEMTSVGDQAKDYLAANLTEKGNARIWVFFTDKGVMTEQQLSAALEAAGDVVSERAKARRAKHGVAAVKFSDLSVRSDYVEQVENLGAKLRRVSKWLNAASFEVTLDKLDQIAALEFVSRVQPVALYKREVEEIKSAPPEKDQQGTTLDNLLLSYGSSLGQLTQINVPVCHDEGYSGQGVIVSMFDTGFRTDHQAFATALSEGRLLDEYDFVFDDDDVDNEPEDVSSAWSHGTSTWSCTGGAVSGVMYGPAYSASFILCKTEDVRSETEVEEDNWAAAVEWVESLGTDIISSSLGYTAWYTSSDYNGDYCVTTIAADMAAENGILVCNSAGNGGPGASTLGAPADADSILAVGAVNSSGSIASFSSRGPTADGRIKPEVCAQGVSTYLARSTSTTSYGTGSGTSFSCPLTAGVAAVVMSAHPEWTNMQVREAMMMTADNAGLPNNTYGWGILNAWDAINYTFEEPCDCLPGDADGNGPYEIADAVYVIDFIFIPGSPAPTPYEVCSGDADCNGIVEISDAVYLINYVFTPGAPAPCTCEEWTSSWEL